MHDILFVNARIIDTEAGLASDLVDVRISGGRIAEIGPKLDCPAATRIDANGRFMLAGLIDCHVHPFLADANISRLAEVPPTLMSARAVRILERMLQRGFTSVRDAAGADWGIRQAVEEGLIKGPRLFIAGRALSQTGGHGDFRSRTDDHDVCHCQHALAFTSRIADGIDDVRRAVREELRKGADQIKIMVSGGASSPHDPLERNQYSPSEISVIVEEAERRGTYVMAHAYGADAIRVALECGVRTIEHGNMIDQATAELAAAKGAYLVPTLTTYEVLAETASESSWSEAMLAKLALVREAGLESIRICRAAGVKLGFGTDLLGDSFDEQSREFLIRSQVESPAQILDSATRVNAEIVGQVDQLGVIKSGAIADLLLLDRNPLEYLSVLQDQGEHIAVIVKDGAIIKNRL
ncbi:amidohydrolase family protein [Parasphingorhabdus sp.]|mgnify:CR=1 FL=1|uniref:metal-dependent hydrolase family protein n=1 Tax=Parasphingorhabdus sp. TaxID=2709688 RepID=UPI001B717F9B|nr:amidohydrolase family protein [Parasphingorhabdus sp.]MBQ0771769.1 amidohydrolase family protein [Sphingomonadales bacterium]|tara:strand:- start:14519 stop:15748 length:1230 start_codon:yes stop_codon:yes gene_type:complete